MNQDQEIQRAVTTLKRGGVVIFPTDTVWGIGASAASKVGINRLYTLKHRPPSQPTAILVKDVHQARKYGVFTLKAKELAIRHWPGALTIIVPATPQAPHLALGEGKSVGLRAPNFPLVQELAHQLGEGIVASSANVAGAPPPKKRGELDHELVKKADFVFKEGEAGGQKPSTVIDATTEEITFVRRGGVTIKK